MEPPTRIKSEKRHQRVDFAEYRTVAVMQVDRRIIPGSPSLVDEVDGQNPMEPTYRVCRVDTHTWHAGEQSIRKSYQTYEFKTRLLRPSPPCSSENALRDQIRPDLITQSQGLAPSVGGPPFSLFEAN